MSLLGELSPLNSSSINLIRLSALISVKLGMNDVRARDSSYKMDLEYLRYEAN